MSLFALRVGHAIAVILIKFLLRVFLVTVSVDDGASAVDQRFLFLAVPGPLVDLRTIKMEPLSQTSDE